MKIKDLIELLSSYEPESKVMILDGFNGGGNPREINLHSTQNITTEDAEESSDCEDLVGETVVVLGFGCY